MDLGAHRSFWKDARALPGRSDTNLRLHVLPVPLEPCTCMSLPNRTDQNHCDTTHESLRASVKLLWKIGKPGT